MHVKVGLNPEQCELCGCGRMEVAQERAVTEQKVRILRHLAVVSNDPQGKLLNKQTHKQTKTSALEGSSSGKNRFYLG